MWLSHTQTGRCRRRPQQSPSCLLSKLDCAVNTQKRIRRNSDTQSADWFVLHDVSRCYFGLKQGVIEKRFRLSRSWQYLSIHAMRLMRRGGLNALLRESINVSPCSKVKSLVGKVLESLHEDDPRLLSAISIRDLLLRQPCPSIIRVVEYLDHDRVLFNNKTRQSFYIDAASRLSGGEHCPVLPTRLDCER